MAKPGHTVSSNSEIKTRVVFFQVKDTSTKLSKIYQTSMAHFEKKEPLLILAPNQAALEFVDALLWRMPEESFLPHVVSESPCSDVLVLSTVMANLNQAAQVFNLTSNPIFFDPLVKTIYEFEDLTSLDKKQLSQERYLLYRKAGFLISSH